MATSTLFNTIKDVNGVAIPNVPVTITLVPGSAFRRDDFTEVAPVVNTTSNGSGFWSIALERNSNISPSGTYYVVTEQVPAADGGTRSWAVQIGDVSQSLLASLVTPAAQQPTVVPSGVNLLTQVAADARYQQIGGLGSSTPSTVDAGDTGTAGVSTSASRADHEHPVSITAAQLVPTGAWTAFTPTLTQSGAVTKTVTYGRYIQLGKLVIAEVFLAVTGSGTAANTVVIGLPVTAASSGVDVGGGDIYDTSVAQHFWGPATLLSTTTVALRSASATNNFLGGATFSAGLAAGDEVRYSVMYEAA